MNNENNTKYLPSKPGKATPAPQHPSTPSLKKESMK